MIFWNTVFAIRIIVFYEIHYITNIRIVNRNNTLSYIISMCVYIINIIFYIHTIDYFETDYYNCQKKDGDQNDN